MKSRNKTGFYFHDKLSSLLGMIEIFGDFLQCIWRGLTGINVERLKPASKVMGEAK